MHKLTQKINAFLFKSILKLSIYKMRNEINLLLLLLNFIVKLTYLIVLKTNYFGKQQ